MSAEPLARPFPDVVCGFRENSRDLVECYRVTYEIEIGGRIPTPNGGPSSGAPKGNQNAWKQGRFAAEAIARRREVAGLLRTVRKLLNGDM